MVERMTEAYELVREFPRVEIAGLGDAMEDLQQRIFDAMSPRALPGARPLSPWVEGVGAAQALVDEIARQALERIVLGLGLGPDRAVTALAEEANPPATNAAAPVYWEGEIYWGARPETVVNIGPIV
jgi:hypothetical protein